jgi:uncharacterized MAPEG superfamily protein
MTIAVAYWCVLVAALLPYVWTTVAKGSGERYDNRDPRGWIARQTNPRVQRANSAQLNAFEAFAPFAAGVVFAQLAGVPEGRIAVLARGVRPYSGLLHGGSIRKGMKHIAGEAWCGSGGFLPCVGWRRCSSWRRCGWSRGERGRAWAGGASQCVTSARGGVLLRCHADDGRALERWARCPTWAMFARRVGMPGVGPLSRTNRRCAASPGNGV